MSFRVVLSPERQDGSEQSERFVVKSRAVPFVSLLFCLARHCGLFPGHSAIGITCISPSCARSPLEGMPSVINAVIIGYRFKAELLDDLFDDLLDGGSQPLIILSLSPDFGLFPVNPNSRLDQAVCKNGSIFSSQASATVRCSLIVSGNIDFVGKVTPHEYDQDIALENKVVDMRRSVLVPVCVLSIFAAQLRAAPGVAPSGAAFDLPARELRQLHDDWQRGRIERRMREFEEKADALGMPEPPRSQALVSDFQFFVRSIGHTAGTVLDNRRHSRCGQRET